LEKVYKVGEVTFTQRPLLMRQVGPLLTWVESLPEDHILRNLTSLQQGSEAQMFGVLKKMLLDGSLLEALSRVLISPMSPEEGAKHLDNNLDVVTGMQMVADFFTFNMKMLSESLGTLEVTQKEVQTMMTGTGTQAT
jgi:hypothetical protein